MTNKEFYREFGNIDPKMIEAAAPAEKVQKKKKNTWVKWVSIAACFCLIVTATVLLIPHIIRPGSGNNNVGQESANANPLSVGYWYANNKEESVYFRTRVFYKSCEDNTVTILLEKADNQPIYWHLKGMNIKDSWLDENGKPDYDATSYYASTDSKYEEYGTRVENAITFTVNGNETNKFPTQPGLYEITIDFSKLAEMCTELDYYLISSYEAFYIGEQKTVDYPEDWEK